MHIYFALESYKIKCCLCRLAMHGERDNKHKAEDAVPEGAVPAYLLDREATTRAKVGKLSGRYMCG